MLARPGLPSFDYVRASTSDEVVSLLEKHREAARLLMGGTDLFPGMRDGIIRPQLVVDVKHLPGMQEIAYNAKSGLMVGAAATMNRIARHSDIQAQYPLLAEAAGFVGTYQVRNRATIGGNLCNASPCADTALATVVLEGNMVLFGPGGEREVAAADFFLGPGQTVLQAGEFLTAIRYPVPPPGAVGRHLKLSRNRLGDLAIVSVEVFCFPDATAASGFRFRIGLGSVAPVVLRAVEAEEALATNPPGAEAFALAAEWTMKAASPINDVRASAAYRSAMVRSLTLRALRDVWKKLAA
jgi:carbon-monoxide dehydrogenase medium subunit